jgi:hypothetical protein
MDAQATLASRIPAFLKSVAAPAQRAESRRPWLGAPERIAPVRMRNNVN